MPFSSRPRPWRRIRRNGSANIIDDGAEARINEALNTLRQETGIEATVLTIFTLIGYAQSGSIESFATGLFNHWGIGDATKNDGILTRVVTEDREMRIELGSGYSRARFKNDMMA